MASPSTGSSRPPTPRRRTAIVDGVVRRALDPFLEAIERPTPPGWHTARHNWNTVCNGGAVVLALALQGVSRVGTTGPPSRGHKAARVLAKAVPAMDHYWNHLGDDGAWDEGTGYWRYGHRYALMAAEALRRTGHPAGEAVFTRPAFGGRATSPSCSTPVAGWPRGSATRTVARPTRSSTCSARATATRRSSGTRTACR